jgi:hypothetical protein
MSLDRTQLTIRLPKTGKIEMKKKIQRLTITTAFILSLSGIMQSANAIWYIDRLYIDGELSTPERMMDEGLLQVRSDIY